MKIDYLLILPRLLRISLQIRDFLIKFRIDLIKH